MDKNEYNTHFSDPFYKRQEDRDLINGWHREAVNLLGTEIIIFMMDRIKSADYISQRGEHSKPVFARPFKMYAYFEAKSKVLELKKEGLERKLEGAVEISIHNQEFKDIINKLKNKHLSDIRFLNETGNQIHFKKIFDKLWINDFKLNLSKKSLYDLKIELEKLDGLKIEYTNEGQAVEIIQFEEILPDKGYMDIYIRDMTWDGCEDCIDSGDLILLPQERFVQVLTAKVKSFYPEMLIKANLAKDDDLMLYEFYYSRGYKTNIKNVFGHVW